jgi:hypothetical protein
MCQVEVLHVDLFPIVDKSPKAFEMLNSQRDVVYLG